MQTGPIMQTGQIMLGVLAPMIGLVCMISARKTNDQREEDE